MSENAEDLASLSSESLDDEAHQKIMRDQLIQRLTDYALGRIELSPGQLRAIEIVFRRTVPGLRLPTLGEPKSPRQPIIDELE